MTTRPKPQPGTAPQHTPSWREKNISVFKRKDHAPSPDDQEAAHEKHEADVEEARRRGGKRTKYVQEDGESGRTWIHPWKFIRICGRSSSKISMLTNILWPFTIAAMVLHFGCDMQRETIKLWVFITAYIGMVPCANLVGFAGQELARKLPTVLGVVLETTFGSIVEIVLFMVLIKQPGEQGIHIIQAAILGSILANLLLCLGLCFFIGGIFHPNQTFHEAVSEVGSNLMLVAGMGLVIPSIFYNSLASNYQPEFLETRALHISRITAIVLLIAFVVYLWFQIRSHHGLYEDILKADEHNDHDRHKDLAKDKLTFTEAAIAVVIGVTFVSFMAVFLVQQIEYIVERGVSDSFMGLILVPVIEKASEHLTAMDEAYDNQMNFALSHVLGASIQTALLNTPLVVLVGWGLDKNMGLNFEMFDAIVLILAIIVIGNFLRDEKSDYLEGALSVFVYVLIAVAAWYYPAPPEGAVISSGDASGGEHARMMKW
ncbi:hypothetical protein WHR41_06408 [Cladosporium halotolerans]|uniref:Vacuolar calcium ion transporter n=1 Tax=Cladosporium halotolerans TaxID=1052096 RepID=A0AB34KMV3_9PEZI